MAICEQHLRRLIVRLLVQPGAGVAPLLSAIRSAKKSIEIMIFRFDQREIELALEKAVTRGVFVHALIAYTNSGEERSLRNLESRLLSAGVTVGRTAHDLARYHTKLMIVDRRVIYLMTFNYTHLDIARSRSFGLVTENKQIVREAVKLFKSDVARKPYKPGFENFVVSPVNARKRLSAFIKGARKQLLIYDGKLTDPQIIRLLQTRANAGVEIRVIGHFSKQGSGIQAVKLAATRLHAQAIIRDGRQVFLGSQSLRKVELDARREVGLITRDPRVVKTLLDMFEADWLSSILMNASPEKKDEPTTIVATLKEIVKDVVKDAVVEAGGAAPGAKEVKDVVQEAIKDAVKEVAEENELVEKPVQRKRTSKT
jgi:phosphatidylserine/phosphatidylglycerophosphate/cardiolipin synthase-like enzyme